MPAVIPPSSYQREWQVALGAIREAALICQALQGEPLPVAEKSDGSPVTVADFAAQALICDALARSFPDDPVVAEEDSTLLRTPDGSALLEQVTSHVRRFRPAVKGLEICCWIDHGTHRGGDRFWALDPLDGSKGFLRGQQYAIALALIEGGQVKLGLLACPNLPRLDRWPPVGSLLAAVEGEGAWAMDLEDLKGASRLSVSTVSVPALASACESVVPSHTDQGAGLTVTSALGLPGPPLRLDSQVKCALVAGGAVEAYFRIPQSVEAIEHVWDHAAGSLLVVEAGGRMTDLGGRKLEFLEESSRTSGGILATNGVLHASVLQTLGILGLGH